MKRRFCAVLALCLWLASFSSFASSGGLGDAGVTVRETLCEGLEYTQIIAANDSGSQIGYVFSYAPGGQAGLRHTYGAKLYGRESAASMLDLAQADGINVFGAVNGDEFAIQTGVPLGLLISDGMILSFDRRGRNCVGVRTDRNILTGLPEVSAVLTTPSGTFSIDSYNKAPAFADGMCLLSPAFARSTKSSGGRTELILRPTGGAYLRAGQTVNATLTAVSTQADTAIPDGCFALSISNTDGAARTLAALPVGSGVSIHVTLSGGWEDADFVTGTSAQILKDGKTVSTDTALSARTAIGITSAGKLLFFACDGDGKYAGGLNAQQTATELRTLGCTQAYLLDCEESTFAALKTDETAQKITHQSDRLIGGCILFTGPTDNGAAKLRITPSTPVLMTGGSLALSCEAVTASGKATGESVSDAVYSLISGPGTLTDGIYKGTQSGNAVIGVTANCGGKRLLGQTTVTVISALDGLTLSASSVSVPVGGQAKLPIMGRRSALPVYLPASALKWSFTGTQTLDKGTAAARCTYGYIDNDLVFHADAAYTSGSFTVSATYGYQTISLQVLIGKEDVIITDFDDRSLSFSSYLVFTDQNTYQYTDGKHQTAGMRFCGSAITYSTPYTPESGASAIKVWVKGSCSAPYARIMYADRTVEKRAYSLLLDYASYNGWRQYSLALPAESVSILSPLASDAVMDCIVDEITLSYGTDTPAFGDVSNSWAKNDIQIIYDLDLTNGYLSGGKRLFHPSNTLTRAEFAKMIVGYYQIDLSLYADQPLDFADRYQIPKWAAPYIRAALGSGLMLGSTNPDGSVSFLPSEPISRAQLVTVVARKLDAPEAELTFSDAASVPKYARSGVRKAVGAGIINGYPDGSFRPAGNITRAECARVLCNLYQTEYK